MIQNRTNIIARKGRCRNRLRRFCHCNDERTGRFTLLQWLRRKQRNHEKPGRDRHAGIHKKSFELNYNGGTIWCEHLDGMGHHEQEVVEKFERDLAALLRPSVSSSMIINLDETVITNAITDAIVNSLTAARKKFRKIAFVGVDRKHQPALYHSTSKMLKRTGWIFRPDKALRREAY